jgi:translocation and assembly module TamB
LAILAILLLNTPWGQNVVRGRVEAYLNNKLKTTVHIGHLGYGLPKFIVINDVLFLDQANDTLLAAHEIKVDLDMVALIHKKVNVQEILLDGVHAHIYRTLPDTNFNFSYIAAAFASNTPVDTTKKKDSSSSFSMNLDRVKLDDIHFRFDDHTGGMQYGLNLEHLDLKMKKLDLDHMLFHIKDLTVAGLQTSYSQDSSYLPPNPHPTKTVFKLIADNVNLQRIALDYDDKLNKFLFGMNLGEVQLQLNQFDMTKNIIDVKKLLTKNANIVLAMGSQTTRPAFVDTLIKKDSVEGWHINGGNVDLANVNFKMDDNSAPKQKLGLDYLHLDLKNADLRMNDFLYTSDTVAGSIRHFSGSEQCGLQVIELKTDFNNNPQGATLSHLYFQTPTSIVQDHLEVHYPSVAAVTKRTQLLQLNLHVVNSTVGLHDLLMFAPQLQDIQVFKKHKNQSVKLEASITGFLNDMNIAHFYASGFGNTQVVLNGRLSGLPEPAALSYNLNITRFQSSRTDVAQFVPDTLLSSVRLPDRFGFIGKVAGNMKDVKTDLYFNSTDGMAYIKGYVATSPGRNREKYDLDIRTVGLNLGRILKQDTLLGPVTATINAKGVGFDMKKMTATAEGDVASAVVKNYRYHNIKFSGNVAKSVGNISLNSADTNMQLTMTGYADFNGKYPAARADIKIDSINFQALKLYSSELRARGTIHADFPVLNPDYPRGEFVWWSPVIVAQGSRYFMDSIYVVSKPSADSGQNITADLSIVQATIRGKTPLTKIGAIIQEHINRHGMLPVKDTTLKKVDGVRYGTNTDFRIKINKKPQITKKQSISAVSDIPADYDLTLNARVINKPMLRSILPALTSFDSIHVDGSLTPRQMALNASIPRMVYSTISIRNANARVAENDSTLTYNVNIDEISQGKYALYYADIHGDYGGDRMTANVSLSDAGKKERFAIKADMRSVGDSQIISILPGLKLNYENWDVAQPNKVVLTSKGFYVQNVGISNKDQFIRANNSLPQPNTPLKIDIGNFLLANLTNIVSKGDTLPANGSLSGNVTIAQWSPEMKMTGDLSIKDLSVFGDTLGNMQALLNNNTDNAIDTRITLKGYGNDISLAGLYYLNRTNGNDLNMTLDVTALAVHSFEGLTMHQIRNSSGFLRGNLKVQGLLSAPEVTGELRTDNLVTTISAFNSEFKMPAEKIVFTPNKITFNDFNILDSKNNKAQITGTIGTEYLTNMDLNLKVDATDWQALHSTAKDNKEYYGDLFLTTHLTITGTTSTPSVDGSINVLSGTKLTVLNPQQNPELQSTKGIVAFVNMRDTSEGKYLIAHPIDTTTKKHKLGLGSSVNVNIGIDKTAQFSLIIDEASGDFIAVTGDGNLNAAVTPGGQITLAGSYVLHGGSYQMNYNFIKRKFVIQDGSSIIFGGDPVAGTTLDITAIYEAKIPPYDLVMRQVSDPAQLNYFKQSLPFDVDLILKGKVLQPAISFDVVLPEGKVYPLAPDQIQLIQGKLSQLRSDTTELNKQVFAVLVLSRFVSDDPFSSGASTSLQYSAMQSVSTFIGEQLNQAAGKLIKGVDLSVDLATTDDYTTGGLRQRTDLNLAASKRLLNDRLKLTVGNDFELEGPQTNNQASSVVPSNLAADYLLTADGRYTMQVYRRNYDEGVLEGYVTETGINFILNVDYDRFKTVFMKSKPKKQSSKGSAK